MAVTAAFPAQQRGEGTVTDHRNDAREGRGDETMMMETLVRSLRRNGGRLADERSTRSVEADLRHCHFQTIFSRELVVKARTEVMMGTNRPVGREPYFRSRSDPLVELSQRLSLVRGQ